MQHHSNPRCFRCCQSLWHRISNSSMKMIMTAFYRYVVNHTILCRIYQFKMIQNTNNNTRATQDISKSATEVTRGFAKWLGFPVTWSEDRNRPSDLEEQFQVTWAEGIHTEFEVMAVTPQTPKCHHNRGVAEVVVTFGSLWCHSHDRKRGINFYSIIVPHN